MLTILVCIILSEDHIHYACICYRIALHLQATADKLKAQLDKARQAKEEAPVEVKAAAEKKSKEGEEDMTVVLTRVDRSGNVRPLPQRQFEPPGGKRRRKKDKVGLFNTCNDYHTLNVNKNE